MQGWMVNLGIKILDVHLLGATNIVELVHSSEEGLTTLRLHPSGNTNLSSTSKSDPEE